MKDIVHSDKINRDECVFFFFFFPSSCQTLHRITHTNKYRWESSWSLLTFSLLITHWHELSVYSYWWSWLVLSRSFLSQTYESRNVNCWWQTNIFVNQYTWELRRHYLTVFFSSRRYDGACQITFQLKSGWKINNETKEFFIVKICKLNFNSICTWSTRLLFLDRLRTKTSKHIHHHHLDRTERFFFSLVKSDCRKTNFSLR